LNDNDDEAYADAIVETIAQPLLVLDEDLRVERANAAFCRQFEVSAAETRHRPVYELGNGQWDIPELRRLLAAVPDEDGGAVEDFRVEHGFERIGKRTMLLNARRMRRPAAPDRILLAISDVTERARLLHEIEGRREFAEKLIDSVREALLVLHWDLRVHSANRSFYELFATNPQETEGRSILEIGQGNWNIPELRRLLEQILPKETAFDNYEVDHEFDRIGRRVMLLNGRRLDHLNLIILAILDDTERREHEHRQQAFTAELQHRVKNILSNVSALASQTRRGSPDLDTFFEAYQARLGALARAQELLVRRPLDTVELAALVRSELGAIGAEEGRGYTIDGPEVRLSPRNAQAMAMAVHELTTNAAKYGALHVDGARITIKWRIEGNAERVLQFIWREQGVPIEDVGPHRGFGSRLIEQSLPHMLGGMSELSFGPGGATCRIEFALPER
jgi:two-component sensor histidine kinase/PAS domain-containing protein